MNTMRCLLLVSLALPAAALPSWTPAPRDLPPNAMVMLGKGRNLLGGWNHLPSEAAAYDPGAMAWVEGERDFVPIVLVRKLGDWDHQHLNGLEGLWSGLTFERVASLVIDFRISDTTRLPTQADIRAAYGPWLSPTELAALDASRPAVRFTLTGPSGVWSAECFVDLTPAQDWTRLEIPIEDFTLFRGVPWDKKPLTAAELTGARVGHLRIEPEALGDDPAKAGSTARNFAPAAWESGNPPELLKEIGLDLAAVFVRLR